MKLTHASAPLLKKSKRRISYGTLRDHLILSLFVLFSLAFVSTLDCTYSKLLNTLYAKRNHSDLLESKLKFSGSVAVNEEAENADSVEWVSEKIDVSKEQNLVSDLVSEVTSSSEDEPQTKKFRGQEFQLHMMLLAYCDQVGLELLLKNIEQVDFGGDLLFISVVVNCSSVAKYVKDLAWPHGSIKPLEISSDSPPISLWWPATPNEHLFYVSVGSKVSLGLYTFLKSVAMDHKTASKTKLISMGEKEGDQRKRKLMQFPGSSGGQYPITGEKTKVESSLNNQKLRQKGKELHRKPLWIRKVPKQGANKGKSWQDWGQGEADLMGINLDRTGKLLGVTGGQKQGEGEGAGFWLAGKKAEASAAFLIHGIAEKCQLLFPDSWIRFWRWHAAAQAPQVTQVNSTEPRWKYDAEAYDFSRPCRKDWLQSLLTFSTEFDSFNLQAGTPPSGERLCTAKSSKNQYPILPAGKALSAARQVAPIHRLNVLPRRDRCGVPVRQGFLARSPGQLKKNIVAREGAVAGVMVSPGYDDMLFNWLCYVKELNIKNFFVITQDTEQAHKLTRKGLLVLLPRSEGSQSERFDSSALNPTKALNYGSLPYKRFILERTIAIGQVLKAGYNVLLADVDSIWLDDPFRYFQDPRVDIFAQLEDHSVPCGGFLYLIRSRTVLRLWDEVTSLYRSHVEWLEAHPFRNRSDPSEFERLLDSQKHNHEQKYLRDVLQSGQHRVTLRGLDPIRFINGRDYFDRKKAQMQEIVPVMIHNNYVVGKRNKTLRFKRKGMWRIDAGQHCKCLSVSCEPGASGPWSNFKVKLPLEEIRARTKKNLKNFNATTHAF